MTCSTGDLWGVRMLGWSVARGRWNEDAEATEPTRIVGAIADRALHSTATCSLPLVDASPRLFYTYPIGRSSRGLNGTSHDRRIGRAAGDGSAETTLALEADLPLKDGLLATR